MEKSFKKTTRLILDKSIQPILKYTCNDLDDTVNMVEYCIFFYNKIIKNKDNWDIPKLLLMFGENVHYKHVQITTGKNVCDQIIENVKSYNKSYNNNTDPFNTITRSMIVDKNTIIYKENKKNIYYMFLNIDPENLKENESYKLSETKTDTVTDVDKNCLSFLKWIESQKNKTKTFSSGQKASIATLLGTLAATGAGIMFERYKSSKKKKVLRVHKFVFEKKSPTYYLPILYDDMKPTNQKYQVSWLLYKKTLNILIPRINHYMQSNQENVIKILEKYCDKLFPVPAWKNSLFLENQAKLTTIVLFLNKKNITSNAALLFWNQFKENKKVRRNDFVKALKEIG